MPHTHLGEAVTPPRVASHTKSSPPTRRGPQPRNLSKDAARPWRQCSVSPWDAGPRCPPPARHVSPLLRQPIASLLSSLAVGPPHTASTGWSLHSPRTQRIAPRSTQPRAVASRPTQVRGTALPTPARGLALAASCRREGLCSAAIEGRQRVAGGGHTAPGIHAPTTAAQLRHHWSVRIIADITSMGKGERQMLMPTSTSSAKRQSFCFKKSNPLNCLQ